MLIKKLATFTTTGILLLGSLAPAAFANSAIIGNGFGSDNATHVNSTNTLTVEQNNTTRANNTVDSQLVTGNNTANNLTGGSASISTGDALSSVGISNTANLNQAHLNGVNDGSGNEKLIIEGNGAGSSNAGSQTSSDNASLFQTNLASLTNHVTTDANTGNNAANNLTGGDASIRTGAATTFTDIMNEANSNKVHIMGGLGSDFGGNAGVIAGNGSFSASSADLNSQRALTVVQDNAANFNNGVWNNLTTGNNSASNGTDSHASINTGGAFADTNVRNLANENNTQIDLLGGVQTRLDKIWGNGAESANSLTDNSNSNLSVFGTNNADLNNQVGPNLHTGNNAVNNQTGGFFLFSDPSVRTGQAMQQTTIENEANDNQIGAVNLGGTNFSFSFDPMGLFGGLL